MRERALRGVEARYWRAVKTYSRLVEDLKALLGGDGESPLKRKLHQMADAIAVLGECIADVPGVTADWRMKVQMLRSLHDQANRAGLDFRYDDEEPRGDE